jgi:hypothetical protein
MLGPWPGGLEAPGWYGIGSALASAKIISKVRKIGDVWTIVGALLFFQNFVVKIPRVFMGKFFLGTGQEFYW